MGFVVGASRLCEVGAVVSSRSNESLYREEGLFVVP